MDIAETDPLNAIEHFMTLMQSIETLSTRETLKALDRGKVWTNTALNHSISPPYNDGRLKYWSDMSIMLRGAHIMLWCRHWAQRELV